MTDAPRGFWQDFVAAAAASDPSPRPLRFNPRPPGVIVPGSGTDVVLRLLREAPGTMSRAQIIWRSGKGRGAVDWALEYLRSQGLIDVFPDGRNLRYLRYRARKEAGSNGD